MGTVERVVFLSLLLDLFGEPPQPQYSITNSHGYAAFTIPLPLFPRIIEWYTVVSGS